MNEKTITYRSLTSGLTLVSDELHYKGKSYPLSSVQHLRRYAERSGTPLELWLGYGGLNFLDIRIYLNNVPKPIRLTTRFALFRGPSRLKNLYKELAITTFQQRMKLYLAQLDDKGFFEYDNSIFFPSGQVSIKGESINLHAGRLFLEPFKFVVKKSPSVLAKKFRVSTYVDQDVFLALLKHLYGIAF